jgi:hypothetical protein
MISFERVATYAVTDQIVRMAAPRTAQPQIRIEGHRTAAPHYQKQT